MYSLYIISIISLSISYYFSKEKTIKSLQIAWKKFSKILPGYLKLLIILSFVLLISDDLIIRYLGGSGSLLGIILGLITGSITMMPGFIAYPLSGILLEKGVSYMVIASFITTLMMVGVVTYPVEKEYMGKKATIVRNIASFIIAAIIAIATGILYGEVL
ncbi:MAG TPA: hypothetical protein VJ907_03160 [Halanaerobiales bacterium]|nr:hypothetical protein [Halanaerobiales bacterium]